jgi:glutamate N-acetyltransferase / amino-acid N-acetyltransferase
MDEQFNDVEAVSPLSLAVGEIDQSGISVVEGGGVSSAQGFKAAGIHAGFRADPDRLDYGLVVSDEPCACAATFTTNVFCAAPVSVSREHLDGCSYGTARAVSINSGIANAATGKIGLETAQRSTEIVAEAVGCTANEVLVASTGVIGQHLDLAPFESGAPSAVAALSRDGGANAARAIMTTDTHPKEAAVSFSGDGIGYPGVSFMVGGMAKGSGMIMPNMATMISVITTDAPVNPDFLHEVLVRAVNLSFNKVTVDSDTSTNDSCFLMASGAAASGADPIEPGSPAAKLFERAVSTVCCMLAREMAADGEGATRLITVRVAGAASSSDADAAARTVANSPLVKTAIFGHDANWGRIAGALGRSGAKFAQEDVAIDIMGLPVCRNGLTVPFDEEEALRRFERPEIGIDVDLGAGDYQTMMWTCDFSYEYVKINGDYRT